MKVDIRSSGLSGAHVRELAASVRTAFRDVAHRIACIVVAVSVQAEKKHAARNCLVEVHMADGHVELVEERQRRLRSALRRAVQRAWKAAARWLARQLPTREPMPASPRALLPAAVRSQSRPIARSAP